MTRPKSTAATPATRSYSARGTGWIAGRLRQKGETVNLTAAAAAYENVAEIALTADEPVSTPAAVPTARKARTAS